MKNNVVSTILEYDGGSVSKPKSGWFVVESDQVLTVDISGFENHLSVEYDAHLIINILLNYSPDKEILRRWKNNGAFGMVCSPKSKTKMFVAPCYYAATKQALRYLESELIEPYVLNVERDCYGGEDDGPKPNRG
jgi:hypothetical protein